MFDSREELIHAATYIADKNNTMDELYHHGILGMKWGVRRYQNEDGSYTDEGKKRYTAQTTIKRGLFGNPYQVDEIVDQNGKKMKLRDNLYMTRQMKKKYKKNDPKKYLEYKSARRDADSYEVYLGDDPVEARLVEMNNRNTEKIRREGQIKVNQMIAEFANTYLDDLERR